MMYIVGDRWILSFVCLTWVPKKIVYNTKVFQSINMIQLIN